MKTPKFFCYYNSLLILFPLGRCLIGSEGLVLAICFTMRQFTEFIWFFKELIKSRGPTAVAEVVAATGANCNTVKLHFRNLVADGHLAAEGVGHGVRYRIW